MLLCHPSGITPLKARNTIHTTPKSLQKNLFQHGCGQWVSKLLTLLLMSAPSGLLRFSLFFLTGQWISGTKKSWKSMKNILWFTRVSSYFSKIHKISLPPQYSEMYYKKLSNLKRPKSTFCGSQSPLNWFGGYTIFAMIFCIFRSKSFSISSTLQLTTLSYFCTHCKLLNW